MIIVISNELDSSKFNSDTEVILLDSLSSLSNVVGDVTDVVIHKLGESIQEVATTLSKYLEENNNVKLWYIHKDEEVNPALEIVITANKGGIVRDDIFLQSPAILKTTLMSGNLPVLYQPSSGLTEVLESFGDMFLRGDKDVPMPSQYREIMLTAIKDTSNELVLRNEQLISISQSASEVLQNLSSSVDMILAEKDKLLENINYLEEMHEQQKALTPMRATATFFPPIKYTKDKDIIRFKDIGGVTYLTSFAFGLRSYLDKVVHKRTKLVVVLPVGGIYNDLYSDYTFITKDNFKDMSLYQESIVFTNYPSKPVLEQLLEDIAYDTFIFVDKTLTSEKHILNSRNDRKVLYGISSKRYANLPSLRSQLLFSSIIKFEGCSFNIPYLKDFPKEDFDREQLYLTTCKGLYDGIIQMRKR